MSAPKINNAKTQHIMQV